MAKNTKKDILKELEELALKAGIKVRYEKTEARGGMCCLLYTSDAADEP